MPVNPAKYDKRVEIWKNDKVKNELKEDSIKPVKVKTTWMQIIPQTGKLQNGQGDTEFSKVDMKFKCRYLSGKEIDDSYWFIFKGRRFDVKYVLNPGYEDIELEIFTSSIRE